MSFSSHFRKFGFWLCLVTKLPKYYIIVYLLFLMSKARQAKTELMEMKISQPIFGILVVLTKNEITKICNEPGIWTQITLAKNGPHFPLLLWFLEVCFDFGKNCNIFLKKKQKMAFIWCWFMKPLVANVVCKARIENDYMLLICTKKPSNCSRKRQCSAVSIHQRQLPKIERVI